MEVCAYVLSRAVLMAARDFYKNVYAVGSTASKFRFMGILDKPDHLDLSENNDNRTFALCSLAGLFVNTSRNRRNSAPYDFERYFGFYQLYPQLSAHFRKIRSSPSWSRGCGNSYRYRSDSRICPGNIPQ